MLRSQVWCKLFGSFQSLDLSTGNVLSNETMKPLLGSPCPPH